ncbi:MAG TPA: hypothetical protein DEF30_04425 [Proteiniclasticum sp.]|uniref:hypothetical protein n=1 Tax=Proteiniclasticum sp. TaxID=2053595 RepID=UPI000E893642|nr:hypothetical protein [Proteiniclasticum sp.]HBW13057.1 hypothetical protein [Proteiniclasticum sp.]
MFRRLSKYFVCMLLIVSFFYTPITASGVDTISNTENLISVQYVYFNTYRNWFEITSEGVAECTTHVTAFNIDSIHVYGSIQQYKNGQWISILSWSHKNDSIENLFTRSIAVSKGSYRYKTTTYLYKNGVLIETDSKTTPQVIY